MSANSSTSWSTVHDFLQNGDSWANVSLWIKVTSGLNNLVRLLEFSDKSRWAARIQIRTKPELAVEVSTMQFIKEHSSLAVPKVFAYALDENNPAAVSYMVIEVLLGIVAMDALGDYKVHRGVIPTQYRPTFYRSVAECHVQLASLRLPKIGTVGRNSEEGYKSGPLPGIGGPFDTAAAFFEAWADTVKFKWDKETMNA